ncbi:hypothetical protein OPV22_027352 [Ensete ventricosum]|uniref:ENTH domain-containing protein n=1 Tax=Ensete ventricosum TaxID=4639 RepID=A0AAV8PZM1_ENSVE|nr:hypothetical protein OPV22_027352 [Ensete ventricosum]
MAALSSGEVKKRSFLKSKIRAARILLTDVTHAQLLAKEATRSKPWPPQDTGRLHDISEAAFDIDDFYRVVDVLHQRFEKFNEKQWKKGYKALILLEYLLTHGPLSFADELASDKEVIQKMCNFHCFDETGHNWGSPMKKTAERVLQLMEKGPFLKEERDRLRQTTRRIHGFGNSTPR